MSTASSKVYKGSVAMEYVIFKCTHYIGAVMGFTLAFTISENISEDFPHSNGGFNRLTDRD